VRRGVCYDANDFVARRILLLFVCMCMCARGDSFDEALRDLAKRIAAHLAPLETPLLTARNLSPMPPSDFTRAQTSLERELRKRVRNPQPVEILLTIADNIRGYLLVAEIRRPNETLVEMEEFRPDPPKTAPRQTLVLKKQFLWEQDEGILDLAMVGSQMLVLEPGRVVLYDSGSGNWKPVDASALDFPAVRDPRGRLEIAGDSVTIQAPGRSCTGIWKPALDLKCTENGEFTPARNTMEFGDWRGVFYQSGQIGGGYLVQEMDGRVHVYDESNSSRGVVDGWGDLAVVNSACGQLVVATSAGVARNAPETAALYEIADRGAIRVSEPLDLPGPVTALWPALWSSGERALAVVHEESSGKYSAYALTVDCGR